MIDLTGLAFVVLGTLAATALRCGWHDLRTSLRAIGGLVRRGFDHAKARAELAHQIEEIRCDGLLRAEPHVIGDDEIDDATSALIAGRTLEALLARHKRYRAERLSATQLVSGVLHQAAELSPVMGLAGTLLALGRLASPVGLESVASGVGIAGTIGMAVNTTFYGLILAHAIFVPLAGAVERRARTEDVAREELFKWMEHQIRLAEPRLAQARDHDDDKKVAA